MGFERIDDKTAASSKDTHDSLSQEVASITSKMSPSEVKTLSSASSTATADAVQAKQLPALDLFDSKGGDQKQVGAPAEPSRVKASDTNADKKEEPNKVGTPGSTGVGDSGVQSNNSKPGDKVTEPSKPESNENKNKSGSGDNPNSVGDVPNGTKPSGGNPQNAGDHPANPSNDSGKPNDSGASQQPHVSSDSGAKGGPGSKPNDSSSSQQPNVPSDSGTKPGTDSSKPAGGTPHSSNDQPQTPGKTVADKLSQFTPALTDGKGPVDAFMKEGLQYSDALKAAQYVEKVSSLKVFNSGDQFSISNNQAVTIRSNDKEGFTEKTWYSK